MYNLISGKYKTPTKTRQSNNGSVGSARKMKVDAKDVGW